MALLANLFGNILNFFYNLFNNYGVAIIIFSLTLRVILLPITLKQQKSMKSNAKLQEKMKVLKEKYKNDSERLNNEIMNLYKEEKFNPLSGCLTSILQIVIIIAVFYVVKSPLTYMKKVDHSLIEKYNNEIIAEEGDRKSAYPEIQIIQKKGISDENVNINMDFLGIDLSKVPTEDLNNTKVYIIPVLYIISSFVSIRLSMAIQNGAKKDNLIEENKDNIDENKKDLSEEEAMEQMNKNMSFFMPFMSITIAIVAPLGLTLYWLVSNVLMIIERLLVNKFMNDNEEESC